MGKRSKLFPPFGRGTLTRMRKMEAWTHLNPKRLISWLLIATGAITLAASIGYQSSILAFIGLSLTFWGALLLVIGTEKYVKQPLLDSTIFPSLAHLNQTLTELKYQGKGVYLPPKYLKDSEASKIFVPKNKNTNLPTPEKIRQEDDKLFLANPEAMLITPPGISLSRLFEKTLGKSFAKVDLEYLQQNLPRLFVDSLEIAEDLEMQTKSEETSTKMTKRVSLIKTEYDTIQVKITNSVYKDACRETGKLSRVHDAIGCPICSAIACALTKATGKPLTIEKSEVTEDGKTIEANFQFLEKIETEEFKAEAPPPAVMGRFLLNYASLFLTAFGSIILAWVGWLMWHDVTEWGKDITLIFFGSRTGEAISLGIGMLVIHYFLIGLALLLSGLLTIPRRRRASARELLSKILLSNLGIFSLTVSGLIILGWVGWLTLYDSTIWGKDLNQIFFGSRPRELISLGIGMMVIHYFLIGLALLLSGLLTFLQRKRSRA